MRHHLKTVMFTSVAAALTLSACGQGSDAESDAAASTESTRESTAVAQPRLVVASDAGVEVLDAGNLEQVEQLDLASRPTLAVAGDDRHVFALQSESGDVDVVDAGTWSEAHGDHSHSYVVDPTVLESDLGSGTSYHAVSDDERSVVWFDDDGSFASFDWKDLEDDAVEPTVVETGTPHHGVAVPTSDGGFLASIAEGEDPVGVAVLDAEGTETSRIEECPGLHGEAHVGEDAYAFGCSTGILVVDGAEGTAIEAPIDGAGTGRLAGDHESDVIVGNLRSEDDDTAATHIALYDVAAGSATAVDIGTEYSGFARSHGTTAVLGTDGALHLVDEESGEVTETIDVVEPWELTDDFTDPKPQVVIGGDVAYVTDPSTQSVVAVDLGNGEERGRTELADVPTSLTVVNAPHEH